VGCTSATLIRTSGIQYLFPHLPQTMLPHPTYEHFGPSLPSAEARVRLGVSGASLLLFFGFVRPYKGLD
jgi:hypothetical protein